MSPGRRVALVLAAAALAAVAVVASGGRSAAAMAPGAHTGASPARLGRFLGIVPTAPPLEPRFSGEGAPPLTYHGGPVQHDPVVYAVFWQPAGDATRLSAHYRAVVAGYLEHVAAAAFSTSDVYAVLTQYYDEVDGRRHFVSNALRFGGAVVATQPLPSAGCANYELLGGGETATCLTDAQAVAELSAVIAADRLPTGLDDEYFLFTPPGVGSCFEDASAPCYDVTGGYCAYHSAMGSAGTTYGNIPYPGVTGCTSGEEPNGGAGDDAVNLVTHEESESQTDPYGTAWTDNEGDEVADECDFVFGKKVLGTTATGAYNQVIDGGDYYVQGDWSDRAKACAWRNVFPSPTAAVTVPHAIVAGRPVRLGVTAHEVGTSSFTYDWTLPGGAHSTAARPLVTFAAAGTAAVSVVVSDAHGDQADATARLRVAPP